MPDGAVEFKEYGGYNYDGYYIDDGYKLYKKIKDVFVRLESRTYKDYEYYHCVDVDGIKRKVMVKTIMRGMFNK